MLEESLKLGTKFLLNNQKNPGNFAYEYDWILETDRPGDNPVRQAGALWSITLLYQNNQTPELEKSIKKGLEFFRLNSIATPSGLRYVVYPSEQEGTLGTVALLSLSYIDYLRAAKEKLPDNEYALLKSELDGYLSYLVSAHRDDGRWFRNYNLKTGKPYGNPTPYYDGESLLALIKAVKYLGYEKYKGLLKKSADAGYNYYVTLSLNMDPDSNNTKGYYQWGSMSFYELYSSGWEDTRKYGFYVIDLANWMIDIHATLERTKNTAYAYEGIIHAYEVANSNV